MKRVLLICLIVAFVATAILPKMASASGRKNVLFIYVDDLNTSLGAYGRSWVHTPNLDKLAARGTRFDRAYCQFSLCNPSRTSLMSGLRPATSKVQDNSTDPRVAMPNIEFLPEYFHKNRYFTAGIGKIAHQAFADSIHFDLTESTDEIGDADYATLCGDPTWCAPRLADKKTLDGRIAKHTIKQLKKHRDGPFFIAAGFSKPHSPDFAPKRYFDLYDVDALPLPEPADDLDGMSNAERRRARWAYYACVSFVDAQIGTLLDALEELGLTDSTVVVVVSDHGYLLGEHGIWNKHSLYEECARVPLIIAAPGYAGNVGGIVELVDVFPTLVELSGLPAATGTDGVSFLPLMLDPSLPGKPIAVTDSFDSHNTAPERSVRSQRYSYIERIADRVGLRLFDRLLDPDELINRVDDPAYQAIRTSLAGMGD